MVQAYSVTNSLIHLELPDIYAIDKKAKNQNDQGMEFWDLMDGGTEVRGGRVPASYLAWDVKLWVG